MDKTDPKYERWLKDQEERAARGDDQATARIATARRIEQGTLQRAIRERQHHE